MPRYYFDVKNGHRLIDPSGLDCNDDEDAIAQGIFIAKQIARELPKTSGRKIAVLNSAREEISKIPLTEKEDHHPGEKTGQNTAGDHDAP